MTKLNEKVEVAMATGLTSNKRIDSPTAIYPETQAAAHEETNQVRRMVGAHLNWRHLIHRSWIVRPVESPSQSKIPNPKSEFGQGLGDEGACRTLRAQVRITFGQSEIQNPESKLQEASRAHRPL
ncbi:MAG: hypothetical protein AB7N24_01030 [Dehalococcoidia bacterium]